MSPCHYKNNFKNIKQILQPNSKRSMIFSDKFNCAVFCDIKLQRYIRVG